MRLLANVFREGFEVEQRVGLPEGEKDRRHHDAASAEREPAGEAGPRTAEEGSECERKQQGGVAHLGGKGEARDGGRGQERRGSPGFEKSDQPLDHDQCEEGLMEIDGDEVRVLDRKHRECEQNRGQQAGAVVVETPAEESEPSHHQNADQGRERAGTDNCPVKAPVIRMEGASGGGPELLEIDRKRP